MFLRKAIIVVVPLLLCLITCLLFRLLDGWLGAGDFAAYLLKGLLLGGMLGIIFPVAGIRVFSSGLPKWLFAGAGLCLAVLLMQYLTMCGVVRIDALQVLLNVNGQVILAEGALSGFMILTGAMYHKR